jgi:hypothetical protein
MLSTPNALPLTWFNRGNSAATTVVTTSAGNSLDPYHHQYPNSSFDQSSTMQLDKSQMSQVQTQSLPPAAFGLATKPVIIQSHVPQNNPGTTTITTTTATNTNTNTGLFNASGITKSVSYLISIEISTPFSLYAEREYAEGDTE